MNLNNIPSVATQTVEPLDSPLPQATVQVAPQPVRANTPEASISRVVDQAEVDAAATRANLIMVPNTPTEIPCNRAAPGRPAIDISIPDNTLLKPEESFTKTWRLLNAGACTWTLDYALVWFSGETFGPALIQNILQAVEPGQEVEISIDMVAPLQPGFFQSNWKLRSADGKLFGLGPAGISPFWVRVEVEGATRNAQILDSTPVSTPAVFLGGSLDLAFSQSVSFDTGKPVLAPSGDFLLKKDPSGVFLAPLNAARLIFFGIQPPTEAECRRAVLNLAPVLLQKDKNDVYICYQTTSGLRGRLRLGGLTDSKVSLTFLTWAHP